MKKYIVVSAFLYIALAIALYMSNTICLFWGTSEEWGYFASYIAGITAPVTALGTIYITYMVYKLSTDEQKREKYFDTIVDLFFRIEDTHQRMKDCLNSSAYENKEYSKCKHQIKQYIVLIRHYLIRFPDRLHSVKDLDKILNHLYFDQDNEQYYKTLANEFESFCFYAKHDQQRPIKQIKDKEGKIDIDY